MRFAVDGCFPAKLLFQQLRLQWGGLRRCKQEKNESALRSKEQPVHEGVELPASSTSSRDQSTRVRSRYSPFKRTLSEIHATMIDTASTPKMMKLMLASCARVYSFVALVLALLTSRKVVAGFITFIGVASAFLTFFPRASV